MNNTTRPHPTGGGFSFQQISIPVAAFLFVLVIVLGTVLAAVLLRGGIKGQEVLEPSISLAPTSGGPRTIVSIAGEGFPEGEVVDIILESNGPTAGEQKTLTITETVTDGDGVLSVAFEMPAEWPDGTPIEAGAVTVAAVTDDGEYRTVSSFFFIAPRESEEDGDSGLIPSITVNPGEGGPGTQISVRVSDFPAGERVTVRLGPANMNLDLMDEGLVDALESRSYGEAITNDDGEAQIVFFMPERWSNSDRITSNQIVIVVSTDGFEKFAAAGFNFIPRSTSGGAGGPSQPAAQPTETPKPGDANITLNPTSGGPGTQIGITGSDFPGDAQVNIRLGQQNVGTTQGSYAVVRTNSTGDFTTSINMPRNWPDGKPIGSGVVTVVASVDAINVSASANFNYAAPNPQISLSRQSGSPGDRVTVDGRDFPPDTRVELKLRREDGDLFRGYGEATTDDDGDARITFTIPDEWPDDDDVKDRDIQIIMATKDGDWEATRTFDVDLDADDDDDEDEPAPEIDVDPNGGEADTEITVTGKNFPRRTDIEIRLRIDGRTYSTVYASGRTNNRGQFELEFDMPDELADGTPIRSDDVIVEAKVKNGSQRARDGFKYEFDNDPPEIDPVDDVTVDQDETVNVDVSATDPDGDDIALSIKVQKISNNKTVASSKYDFDDNGDGTGEFTWVTDDSFVGDYLVTITAEDEFGDSDTETFIVTVNEDGNTAPEIDAIGNQSIDEGETASQDIEATDDDGDDIALTIKVQDKSDNSTLPASAYDFVDNGDGTASFSWVTSSGDAGDYLVTVTADDGNGGKDTETFSIEVGEENTDPEIEAIGNFTIDEGEGISVDIEATDDDGDDITLSFVLKLGTATIPASEYSFTDNGVGTASVSWMTSTGDAGTYVATITANDGNGGSDTEVFTVTVEEPTTNTDPVIADISNQTVDEGEAVGASISATDDDDDDITLSFVLKKGGTTVSISEYSFTDNGDGTGNFSWVTEVGDAGNYTATVTANDGNGGTDTESFNITVEAAGGGPNVAPVIAAITNKVIDEGQTAIAAVNATDANDDDIALSVSVVNSLTLAVVPPADYSFTDNGDGTGSFSWTTTSGVYGIYLVTVTADDGTESSVKTFIVKVNVPGNLPPVIAPLSDLVVDEGDPVSVAVSATDDIDAIVDTVTLSATVVGIGATPPPVGAVFTDNTDGTGTLNWTPGNGSAGMYLVTITANDGFVGISTATFVITVNEPAVVEVPTAPHLAVAVIPGLVLVDLQRRFNKP